MKNIWCGIFVILLKFQSLHASSDKSCSQFISKAIKLADTFTSTIEATQSSCIRSLSLYSVTQYNQPYKEFANALYGIYSDCAKSESDLFVDMYNEMHELIDPMSIYDGDSVGDYLSGSTDVTKFPFSCVAVNIENALDLVAIYDKELKDASNIHLRHHNTPNEDSIDS